MSCSDYHYVLIPKNFDVEEHLSLSELAGISIKTEEVKEVISDIQRNGGAHCQDYCCKNGSYDNGSFDFVVRFLNELGYVLFNEERGNSGDDQIVSMRGHILNNRKLIEQVLKES